MDIWHKILFSTSGVIIVILFGFIVFNDKGLMDRSLMKNELHEITQKKDTVALENEKLYEEIRRLHHDVVYIESLARNSLGMVADDEFVIKYHTD